MSVIGEARAQDRDISSEELKEIAAETDAVVMSVRNQLRKLRDGG